EKNPYPLAPDGRRRLGIEQLPETLGEAIELTSESELVLRTLGEHMFNRYVEIKRQEGEDYRVQVSQWELDRYMAVLYPAKCRNWWSSDDRQARHLPSFRPASY